MIKIKAYKNFPIFNGKPDKFINLFFRHSFEVDYDNDDVIFREDEPSDAIYVIKTGDYAVEKTK